MRKPIDKGKWDAAHNKDDREMQETCKRMEDAVYASRKQVQDRVKAVAWAVFNLGVLEMVTDFAASHKAKEDRIKYSNDAHIILAQLGIETPAYITKRLSNPPKRKLVARIRRK